MPNTPLIPYRRDSIELAQWLASADALVHAGTKETFGLVILEAMACGLPVVAARASAIPELIDESVGMLAEPGSATSMAEAIVALYERDVAAVGKVAPSGCCASSPGRRRFMRKPGSTRTYSGRTVCPSPRQPSSSWARRLRNERVERELPATLADGKKAAIGRPAQHGYFRAAGLHIHRQSGLSRPPQCDAPITAARGEPWTARLIGEAIDAICMGLELERR